MSWKRFCSGHQLRMRWKRFSSMHSLNENEIDAILLGRGRRRGRRRGKGTSKRMSKRRTRAGAPPP
eukprot:9665774-Alexandrium_andersonii.AAC.1